MTKKIKITDLIPLLKPGFVAMDASGEWYWYRKQPKKSPTFAVWSVDNGIDPKQDFQALSIAFDIEKSIKQWDESLIKIGKKK